MTMFFVISSIALIILISIILIVPIACGMYIIGLLNDCATKRVELILLTVANLRSNQKNVCRTLRYIRLLAKTIIYRRRLFINKIKIKNLRQKSSLKNP